MNEIDEVEHHHNHDEIFCYNDQFHQRNHHRYHVYHDYHDDVDHFDCYPCYIHDQNNDDNLFAYLHHGVHDNHNVDENNYCYFVDNYCVVVAVVVDDFAIFNVLTLNANFDIMQFFFLFSTHSHLFNCITNFQIPLMLFTLIMSFQSI